MQEDLEAEKRAFTRAWAKRQRRLELLMTGTAGMYGDFQGIVGPFHAGIRGAAGTAAGRRHGPGPAVGGTAWTLGRAGERTRLDRRMGGMAPARAPPLTNRRPAHTHSTG